MAAWQRYYCVIGQQGQLMHAKFSHKTMAAPTNWQLDRYRTSASAASVAANTATNDAHGQELAAAKPFSECPTYTSWQMMRNFMPGGKYYKKDIEDYVRGVFDEFGDIFRFPGAFGSPSRVITQNPINTEKVLRADGQWPVRTGMDVLTYYRTTHRREFFDGKMGLLTSHGKEWADFRSAVNPILVHPKNAKVYLPQLVKVNDDFIERIKMIRDPATLEMPDNFKEEISSWTVESVGIVALNRRLGLINNRTDEAKRFIADVEEFFELTGELQIKPSLWRYLPNRKFQRTMTILDDISSFTEKYITEAKEEIERTQTPVDEQSVLEKLLKIDTKIATVMAMDMLFAGSDTTTTTFTGLLLSLAKNPEKQAKLREEIMQIMPEKNSPLTAEKMKNLPYLRACIKESLRFYPLTTGTLRKTQQDLVLSGYHIPSGTEVVMMDLDLLRDSKYFSRPNEFLPERWLRSNKSKGDVEQSAECPATKPNNPFVGLPFGFGARSCIGRRIAEMEMEIGIARIIRNFQLEFNYPVENAFKFIQIYVPNVPLKFKFTDLPK